MISALSLLSILMLAFTSSVYGDIYDDIQAQVDLLSGENPTQEFEDMVKGLRDIYYYIKYIEVPIAYDRLAFETILNQINQTIIDIEDEYPSANGIPTDISTVLDGSLVLIQYVAEEFDSETTTPATLFRSHRRRSMAERQSHSIFSDLLNKINSIETNAANLTTQLSGLVTACNTILSYMNAETTAAARDIYDDLRDNVNAIDTNTNGTPSSEELEALRGVHRFLKHVAEQVA